MEWRNIKQLAFTVKSKSKFGAIPPSYAELGIDTMPLLRAI